MHKITLNFLDYEEIMLLNMKWTTKITSYVKCGVKKLC